MQELAQWQFNANSKEGAYPGHTPVCVLIDGPMESQSNRGANAEKAESTDGNFLSFFLGENPHLCTRYCSQPEFCATYSERCPITCDGWLKANGYKSAAGPNELEKLVSDVHNVELRLHFLKSPGLGAAGTSPSEVVPQLGGNPNTVFDAARSGLGAAYSETEDSGNGCVDKLADSYDAMAVVHSQRHCVYSCAGVQAALDKNLFCQTGDSLASLVRMYSYLAHSNGTMQTPLSDWYSPTSGFYHFTDVSADKIFKTGVGNVDNPMDILLPDGVDCHGLVSTFSKILHTKGDDSGGAWSPRATFMIIDHILTPSFRNRCCRKSGHQLQHNHIISIWAWSFRLCICRRPWPVPPSIGWVDC
eukprot:SAG31_NODE_281_length_18584_cov_10.762564_18_plen_360_part_00